MWVKQVETINQMDNSNTIVAVALSYKFLKVAE